MVCKGRQDLKYCFYGLAGLVEWLGRIGWIETLGYKD